MIDDNIEKNSTEQEAEDQKEEEKPEQEEKQVEQDQEVQETGSEQPDDQDELLDKFIEEHRVQKQAENGGSSDISAEQGQESRNSNQEKKDSDSQESFKDELKPQPEETIGVILSKARIAKGDPLDSIVEITKIRKKYLEALEKDEFSVIPNLLVARGFMKIYAEFLKLDVDELITKFNKLYPEVSVGPGKESSQEIKFGATLDKNSLVPKALSATNQNTFYQCACLDGSAYLSDPHH